VAAIDSKNLSRMDAEIRRCIPLLQVLTPMAMRAVIAHGELRSIPADTEIFHEGEPGDYWYCILAGHIRVHAQGRTGKARELAAFQAGETLGELALLDNEPRSATATSITPCRLLLIPRDDFIDLISSNPGLLAQLLRRLVAKIRNDTLQMLAIELEKEHIRTEQEVDRRRAMSQLVAGVAHEINTPLGIANQGASLIVELLPSTDQATSLDAATVADLRQASKLIMHSVGRAGRLVRMFKSLSVNQARDVRETVSLRKLTEETIELFSLEARSKHLRIELDDQLAAEAGDWDGYPAVYSQILLNLLTNIERYAYPQGQGGVIGIALRRDSSTGDFMVEVHDHGHGIAPENLPLIFDPFFTTGRAQGGTGLGLAIVKNLVTESLGGTIRIESRINEGTQVYLTLPGSVCANEAKASAEHPE
jgi:signal transduction histidine kinase